MTSVSVDKIIDANNSFAVKVYLQVAKREGPILCSPVTISSMLALLMQASGGDTTKALQSILHLDKNTLAEGFQNFYALIDCFPDPNFNLLSKIYLSESVTLKPEFRTLAEKKFNTEIDIIKFTDTSKTAFNINGWVKFKTKNRIELVHAGDYSPACKMILLNVAYLNTEWLTKFDASKTKLKNFYKSDKDVAKVYMMYEKSDMDYCNKEELDAHVVEMKLRNPYMTITIILPNRKDGIKSLENKLSHYNLSNLCEGLVSTNIILTLPRFKMETELDMDLILRVIGVESIYMATADFNGMQIPKPLEPVRKDALRETVNKIMMSKEIHPPKAPLNQGWNKGRSGYNRSGQNRDAQNINSGQQGGQQSGSSSQSKDVQNVGGQSTGATNTAGTKTVQQSGIVVNDESEPRGTLTSGGLNRGGSNKGVQFRGAQNRGGRNRGRQNRGGLNRGGQGRQNFNTSQNSGLPINLNQNNSNADGLRGGGSVEYRLRGGANKEGAIRVKTGDAANSLPGGKSTNRAGGSGSTKGAESSTSIRKSVTTSLLKTGPKGNTKKSISIEDKGVIFGTPSGGRQSIMSSSGRVSLRGIPIKSILAAGKVTTNNVPENPDNILKVDKFVSKSCIEMTEEGAEYATRSRWFGFSMKRSKVVNADHPFMYVVSSKIGEKRNVLFMGRFNVPADAEEF